MKKILLAGGAAVTLLALSGCIHVADHGNDVDEVAINTATAVEICGGADLVQSVSDEGFECKED